MPGPKVYVSITGLRIKKPWHVFEFYRLAAASLRQARTAKGNLRSDVKKIGGVHHTITVWESEQAMRAFMYVEPHLSAIRAFRRIASGKTFGFEARSVPDWEEVHRLWHARGQDYV